MWQNLAEMLVRIETCFFIYGDQLCLEPIPKYLFKHFALYWVLRPWALGSPSALLRRYVPRVNWSQPLKPKIEASTTLPSRWWPPIANLTTEAASNVFLAASRWTREPSTSTTSSSSATSATRGISTRWTSPSTTTTESSPPRILRGGTIGSPV